MAKITPAQLQQSLALTADPNQAIAHLLNAIAHEMSIKPQQLITNLKLSAQYGKPLFFHDQLDYEDHSDAL